MKNRKAIPPKWALSFLRWFCKAEFVEEIEGDLLERYYHRSFRYGTCRSNLFFVRDVLSLFKPGLIGSFHDLTSNRFLLNGQVLKRAPEYYVVLLILLAGYNPPYSFGPVALALAAILLLFSRSRNQTIWTVVSFTFLLINLFGILAMASEFSEFPTYAIGAQQLLVGGSSVFLLNISVCAALIVPNLGHSKRDTIGVLYAVATGWYGLGALGLSRRFPDHATSDILFYMGICLSVLTLTAGLISMLKIANKHVQGDSMSGA